MRLTAALFLFSFAFFLVHVVPTVYYGDCGVLLTAIETGGVPHPNGFPAYMLAGTLISIFEKNAFWINCLSALASALAVVLIFHFTAKIQKSNESVITGGGVPLAAVFVFLSSSTLMLHSLVARVYTLNLALVLAFFVWGIRKPLNRNWAVGLGFFLGLAASTHSLFLGGIAFISYLHWDKRREILSLSPWVISGLLFSMSLYLWIPLRAKQQPPVNWLPVNDFKDFWDYITLAHYRFKFIDRDWLGTGLFIKTLAMNFWREWPFPIWILAILGAGNLRKNQSRVFGALVCWILFVLLMMFNYGYEVDLHISYRYLLPVYAASAIFSAFGLEKLFRFFSPNQTEIKRPLPIWLSVLLVIGLLFPVQRWNAMALAISCYDYALNFLKPLPKDATVEVIGDDQIFPLAYAVIDRNLRKDLNIVDWSGRDLFPYGLDNLAKVPGLDRNKLEQDWLIKSGQLFLPTERNVPDSFLLQPYGMVYRISSKENDISKLLSPDPIAMFRSRHYGVENSDIESEEILAELPLQEANYYWNQGERSKALYSAEEAYGYGKESIHTLLGLSTLYGKMDENDKSMGVLQKALALQPHLDTALENVGILYGKMGNYPKALDFLTRALKCNPNNPSTQFYYRRVQSLLSGNKTSQ